MSRKRGVYPPEDLTGYTVVVVRTARSKAQTLRRNDIHYLCWYRVVTPYGGMEKVLSVRADDELQAYVKARQVLEKRGAEIVT